MKRAGTTLVLVTLAWPHANFPLVLGASNEERRYGQFRRRRGSYGASASATTASCPSTPCFLTPFSPIPLPTKAPWGSRRRHPHVRVHPCARRHYYSAEAGSWDFAPGGDGDDNGGGGYTPAAEMVMRSSRPNTSAADGTGSTEAATVGGLAFPLGANGGSKITKVEVKNLAMVDSVSVEVGVRLVCRIGVHVRLYIPPSLQEATVTE